MRPMLVCKRFQSILVKLLYYLKNRDMRYEIVSYYRRGRLPWTPGYSRVKLEFIRETLADQDLMQRFCSFQELPAGFGTQMDELVVEYPRVVFRLRGGSSRLLDAGSSLNHQEIFLHPKLRVKDITIFTLAPELQRFWREGVSYQFGDLRDMPFRNEWFDEIVCISTLEHVGMDNTKYGPIQKEYREFDFLLAAQELMRTLKPGGKILMTVLFGRRQSIIWDSGVFMQQFDSQFLS